MSLRDADRFRAKFEGFKNSAKEYWKWIFTGLTDTHTRKLRLPETATVPVRASLLERVQRRRLEALSTAEKLHPVTPKP